MDANLRLRVRRDHDSRLDLYRSAGQLSAPGCRAVRHGADGGLFAGRLRPPVMGKIHDANGDWHIPLIAVALISIAMAVFGALAGRDREINR